MWKVFIAHYSSRHVDSVSWSPVCIPICIFRSYADRYIINIHMDMHNMYMLKLSCVCLIVVVVDLWGRGDITNHLNASYVVSIYLFKWVLWTTHPFYHYSYQCLRNVLQHSAASIWYWHKMSTTGLQVYHNVNTNCSTCCFGRLILHSHIANCGLRQYTYVLPDFYLI